MTYRIWQSDSNTKYVHINPYEHVCSCTHHYKHWHGGHTKVLELLLLGLYMYVVTSTGVLSACTCMLCSGSMKQHLV